MTMFTNQKTETENYIQSTLIFSGHGINKFKVKKNCTNTVEDVLTCTLYCTLIALKVEIMSTVNILENVTTRALQIGQYTPVLRPTDTCTQPNVLEKL